MKRKCLLVAALISSMGAMYAQAEMDAYKLSRNDLTGTARSVAMGGAFGALGADASSIAINPAGIAAYTKSEVVTTLNFQNTKTESLLSGMPKMNDSKFKFSFDNIAFVMAYPIESDAVPFVNFGFSYNRLKSFDRNYQTAGNGLQSSMTSYMADRANTGNGGRPYDPSNLGGSSSNSWNNDWMAVFGYNAYLIQPKADGSFVPSMDRRTGNIALDNAQSLFVREKGDVSTYDFNVGATVSDIISFGLTISLTDVNYSMYSNFKEDFFDARGNSGGYDFDNGLTTEGSGIQVTPGIIVKPIPELRFGVSYHSPTWYNMTDRYYAIVDHNLRDLNYTGNGLWLDPAYASGKVYSFDDASYPEGKFDYNMRTPDKWTFSMAGIIGKIGILSVDYEYTNYANMNLKDVDGYALRNDPNIGIKNTFKGSSTLRAGGEVRITPQFSARVGYAWEQSPVKTEIRNNPQEVMTAGSVAQFTLDGDKNYITYGLGYRFTRSFYTDVAFVISSQTDDLYSYATSEKYELKTNKVQGLLTLGYKF